MNGLTWALLGAALCTILNCISSAVGVATAGRAGAGVISEKPDLFGKILVLQAIPGSNGIYGFLVTILVLVKVGLLGGEAVDVSMAAGLSLFMACLPMAIAGLGSAIFQGKVAASCIMMTAKDPSLSARGITITALIETYAILSLLTSIVMTNAIIL